MTFCLQLLSSLLDAPSNLFRQQISTGSILTTLPVLPQAATAMKMVVEGQSPWERFLLGASAVRILVLRLINLNPPLSPIDNPPGLLKQPCTQYLPCCWICKFPNGCRLWPEQSLAWHAPLWQTRTEAPIKPSVSVY